MRFMATSDSHAISVARDKKSLIPSEIAAGSKAFAQVSAREWLWLSVAPSVTLSTLTQFFTLPGWAHVRNRPSYFDG
jgi:hypothetical protein